MKFLPSLVAGFAGAAALTIAHQALHQFVKDAPRMDLLGEEALTKVADQADADIPEDKLFEVTMAGDLLMNSLYYSNVGMGAPKHAILRGAVLGVAAGLGGVYVPGRLGLTKDYSAGTRKTSLLTIALYSFGGIMAGLVAQKLAKRNLND